MALIENAKGRRKNQSTSNLERLFGHKELGCLLSRCQAAVISAGHEMEKIFIPKELIKTGWKELPHNPDYKKNQRAFGKNGKIFYVSYPILKIQKDKNKKMKGTEVDFVLEDKKSKSIEIFEIKDGDTFDTKKSEGEDDHLIHAGHFFSKRGYSIKGLYFVVFYARNEEEIRRGTKNKLSKKIILLTGENFCKKNNFDYNCIVRARKKDQKRNIEYFFNQVDEIRASLT